MKTNIGSKDIQIEASWMDVLSTEFDKGYFKGLWKFVQDEYRTNKNTYPKSDDIFRAFDLCRFDQVKVVILGQDPYHGGSRDTNGNIVGQANGLSFAVHPGISLPPSLKNIFKEIESDLNIQSANHSTDGDLSRWAKQGVLLLNSTLTVCEGMPGSHQKKGWEEFTDAVIHELSNRREHIVFLLWGNYAKQKGIHIDRTKHLVLEAPHPSPFSAYIGFFECNHFSKANTYLQEHNLPEIDWR